MLVVSTEDLNNLTVFLAQQTICFISRICFGDWYKEISFLFSSCYVNPFDWSRTFSRLCCCENDWVSKRNHVNFEYLASSTALMEVKRSGKIVNVHRSVTGGGGGGLCLYLWDCGVGWFSYLWGEYTCFPVKSHYNFSKLRCNFLKLQYNFSFLCIRDKPT